MENNAIRSMIAILLIFVVWAFGVSLGVAAGKDIEKNSEPPIVTHDENGEPTKEFINSIFDTFDFEGGLDVFRDKTHCGKCGQDLGRIIPAMAMHLGYCGGDFCQYDPAYETGGLNNVS
jgi:hypothetical protein